MSLIQPQRVLPSSSKRGAATKKHRAGVQTSTAGRAAVRKGAVNGAGPLRPEGSGRGPGASGRTAEQMDFNMAVERTVFCLVCVDVAVKSYARGISQMCYLRLRLVAESLSIPSDKKAKVVLGYL